MNLEQLKKAGLKPDNRKEGKCARCSELFSDANVFTRQGWQETRISGMCEKCWNSLFGDEE